MGKYALFADAFCYPSPGRKEQILTGLQAETDRKVSDAITEFIDQIEEMTRELPDHLVPILKLMDRGTDQPEELKENLEPAIKKMTSELRKRERDNPYLILIDALHRMVSDDQTSSERSQ
jgi:nitrate reductase assembly molybdenum cofactor insertion protein NarJ